MARAILDRGWTLKEIYEELGGLEPSEVQWEFRIFFNGQARELLVNTGVGADVPLTTGEGLEGYSSLALDTLSRGYVVGTQDRFSESVRLFAEHFGWRKAFLPHENVTTHARGTVALDAETRELARSYNSIDTALHQRYSEALRSMPGVSRLSQVRWRARRGIAKAARRTRPATAR